MRILTIEVVLAFLKGRCTGERLRHGEGEAYRCLK